jgi:hypothetical protein
LEERIKRIIGVSLAALSTAAMSTCPLLASTRAQAAVAPLDANTINYGGPATATLVIAGKTHMFKNGTCESIKVSDITVDVTLGSVVQGKDGGPVKGNGKKPYFSIDLAPSVDIVNPIYYGGKKLVDSGSITATGSVVKSGSSKGTFQDSAGAFSGSWNCHGKFTEN